jgi:hypothetical protein
LEDAKAKAADEFVISVERRRAIPFESTPRPLRNTYSSALQLYSSESQRWERWETLNGEEYNRAWLEAEVEVDGCPAVGQIVRIYARLKDGFTARERASE